MVASTKSPFDSFDDISIGDLHLAISLRMINKGEELLNFKAFAEAREENGVYILKFIDEGPFQMGTFRETLFEGNEGALHLGPERPHVYFDLSPEEKERFVKAVKLNRGLRDSNYDQLYAYLKQHEAHANENKMMLD
uniref:Uncharacterized protein n=1 Tax=Tanacetum cinerariifolium TaxID=118510 RepID=A0A6L2KG74_TANCI|nr:hypothetical protein [Tanacetum cinerariifolium]